jgi:hypothetical protein
MIDAHRIFPKERGIMPLYRLTVGIFGKIGKKYIVMKRSILLALIFCLGNLSLEFAPVFGFNHQEDIKTKLIANEESQPIDNSPELKLDLPKLDTTPPSVKKSEPVKKAPLKGSVQHQEMIKSKGLSDGIDGSGTGKLDGSAKRGNLDGSAQFGGYRSRTARSGSADIGLGIIGVKFIMAFGRTPIIYEVFPGTPAAEVGMRPRDIIIAVDGIPTSGLSKDEVYNMIVGQPGTSVTISYKRKNDFQVRQLMRMDLNRIGDPFLRRDYLKM